MRVVRIKKKEAWDWEKIWEQYKDMIEYLAWDIYHKYKTSAKIDYDELLSEGWNAITKKAERYNYKISKKSTWIWECAYHGMRGYCVKKCRDIQPIFFSDLDSDNEDKEYNFEPEDTRKKWFNKLLEEVGEEAQTLLKIIIEAPEELGEVLCTKHPYRSYKAIEAYMVDTMDWNFKDFYNTEWEIKKCLKNMERKSNAHA